MVPAITVRETRIVAARVEPDRAQAAGGIATTEATNAVAGRIAGRPVAGAWAVAGAALDRTTARGVTTIATGTDGALVCQLSRQGHGWLAMFGRDNR